MVIMTVGIIVLSMVLIFVLGNRYTVVDEHNGLYYTSNLERFQTDLYAVKGIVDNNNILKGLDTTLDY